MEMFCEVDPGLQKFDSYVCLYLSNVIFTHVIFIKISCLLILKNQKILYVFLINFTGIPAIRNLTHQPPMFSSLLQSKSVDWFLYERTFVINGLQRLGQITLETLFEVFRKDSRTNVDVGFCIDSFQRIEHSDLMYLLHVVIFKNLNIFLYLRKI